MNLLAYKDYLNWRYNDEKAISPFQIPIFRRTRKELIKYYKSVHEVKFNDEIEEKQFFTPEKFDEFFNIEFGDFFTDFILSVDPPSGIIKFLDYHFDCYAGDKTDFLDFIEIEIGNNIYSQDVSFPQNKDGSIDEENVLIKPSDDPSKKLRRDKVLQWIWVKREKLTAEDQKPRTNHFMSFFVPDFVSFVNEDETPDSPYQSVIPNIETFKKDNPDYIKENLESEYLRLIEGVLNLDFSNIFVNGKPTEIKMYLDYHYNKYLEKHSGEGIDFLYFVSDWILQPDPDIEIRATNEKFINEWIEEKHYPEVKGPGTQTEKIKWNGSPEILGFLFLELVRKGYIDPPLFHGKPNFTGLSRLCGQYFEVNTTPGNLERVFNEENNTLTSWKREQFTIPLLSEIA